MILIYLSLFLALLQVLGVIAWPWLWVLAPAIFGIVATFLFLLTMFIIALLVYAFDD